jgi:hypothetical protein
VLNITDGPKPYLQGIPDSVRPEVMRVLDDARDAYQRAVRASDEDFASGAWNAPISAKPKSPVQLAGGLKATSKKAAKDTEGWLKADTEKRTPEGAAPVDYAGEQAFIKQAAIDWAKSPNRKARAPKPFSGKTTKSRGTVGFAAKDPVADALLNDAGELRIKGALGRKYENVQRAADDTAVANVQNPLLERLNTRAAPGFDRKTTEYMNTSLPGWRPPGLKPSAAEAASEQWTVFDALQWGNNERIRNPEFDYGAFIDDIGERAAGLPSSYTAAEKKAITKLAKEQGQPAPNWAKLTKQRTESHKAVRLYENYLKQMRQSSLFGPIGGPAGFMGDYIGNTWSLIVNGHLRSAITTANPGNVAEAMGAFRHTGNTPKYVNPAEMQSAADAFQRFPRNAHAAADALMDSFLRETGQVLPHDLYPAGTLKEVPVSGKPSLNAAVEGRNPIIRGLANLWTVPGIKDARTATDLVGRTTLTKRVAQQAIKKDGIPALKKTIAKHAGQGNVDQIMKDILATAKANAKQAGVPWKGNFSPADVMKATEGQKYSTDLGRAWQSELNRAIEIGMAEQKKVFFSYKNTNADELVSNVFMFHYWQTRATYMHTRAALRHPVLLNGYYKIFEELRDRNEHSNLGYLGSVYKFMTSPSGIYAAFDPLGILIPTTLIDMQDQEGSKWRVLQNQLTPVVGTLLAIAGITDNVPNITGLRTTERWLINMGNYLVAEGVDMSSVPLLNRIWDNNTMRLTLPIDEAVKTILDEMNAWWGDKLSFVPDFAPFDRGANEKDQINTWVIKGLEEDFGPSTGWVGHYDPETGQWVDHPAVLALDEATDALTTGEPNKYADAAEENYATEGMLSATLGMAVPGGVVTRSGYRDEQIAGNAEDDPQASLNRDLATAADPTWVTMHHDWQNIGTPQEQAIHDTYWKMLLSPEELDTVISRAPGGGTVVLRSSQIAAMSDEEREDFVNRWIALNPGHGEAIEKIQTEQDAFKEAHPQMAEFKEYQKAAYNEDTGGVRAFRTSLAQTNPNFKQEMAEYRTYLEGQGIKGAELERRLDSWAAGESGYLAAMGMPRQNGDKPLPVYDASKNPYANPAMAGLGPQVGGGDSGSGSSGGITKGEDGKLYNEDGQMVNAEGKPINDKGQVIDDYWYPEQVTQRLADDAAKYDTTNQQMEQRFGDNWNLAEGGWEDWANSASERKRLGIYGIPYEYPSESTLMRSFESWYYENPDKTLEDWFAYLMGAPGYGVAADPGASLGLGGSQQTSGSLSGRLEGLIQGGQSSAPPPGGWLWATMQNPQAPEEYAE